MLTVCVHRLTARLLIELTALLRIDDMNALESRLPSRLSTLNFIQVLSWYLIVAVYDRAKNSIGLTLVFTVQWLRSDPILQRIDVDFV